MKMSIGNVRTYQQNVRNLWINTVKSVDIGVNNSNNFEQKCEFTCG